MFYVIYSNLRIHHDGEWYLEVAESDMPTFVSTVGCIKRYQGTTPLMLKMFT